MREMYKYINSSRLSFFIILVCMGIFIFGGFVSEMDGSPIAEKERVEVFPEKGFVNILFGSRSEFLRERLGAPTGVFLIGMKQVHVYGNKAMFFFDRDRLYKYVLGSWILDPAIAEYRDSNWPFENASFFLPDFDVTVGVMYNETEIKEKLGIELSLIETRGNLIEMERREVVIGFRFGSIRGREDYSLSRIVVRLRDSFGHGDDLDHDDLPERP